MRIKVPSCHFRSLKKMASEEESLIPKEAKETDVKVHTEVPVRSRLLTVEPVILFYFIYSTPALLIAEQYIFDVFSSKHNYSRSESSNISICSNDNSSESLLDLQKRVQSESSHVMLILSSSTNVISIFTVILFGAYSDEKGRTLPLAVPILGAIITCIVYFVVITFNLCYWYLLIGSIIDGFLGSKTSCLMACFAYIGDITSVGRRTLRVTVVEVSIGIAITLSQISSGYLIRALGYSYPFIILLGANIINLIYIICFLPETRPRATSSVKFFRTEHYNRVFRLFVKDDGTRRSWKLQLNILILVLVGTATIAFLDPLVYFLKGRPLCFTEVQVGIYTGAANLAQQMGSLSAVKFLEHILGNVGIMILAGVSGTACFTMIAFTQQVWTLALGNV